MEHNQSKFLSETPDLSKRVIYYDANFDNPEEWANVSQTEKDQAIPNILLQVKKDVEMFGYTLVPEHLYKQATVYTASMASDPNRAKFIPQEVLALIGVKPSKINYWLVGAALLGVYLIVKK